MKAAARDQQGNVLVMALILLVVGGLILTPLLGLMSTGLVSGQVYDKKTDELYAADAGVEDAIWKIRDNVLDSYPHDYPEPLIVNNKSVNITVFREDLDPTCGEELRYRIISTATSDDGSSTAIDAHLSVSYLDLSALLDNAIVSNDTIDIQPGNYIDGDVWLPDEEDLETSPGVSINGTVKDNDDMTMYWPTFEQLSGYYLQDVEGAPDPGPSIDLQYYTNIIGPCYREGSLAVDNTGDPATLVLEGTVYVTGNLEFRQSGTSHNYTVDLNKQTIFVEGNIEFPSNVVTIRGPGCIIAKGYINFQPAIAGIDFVLVYSITDEVNFQPSGDFTGCIAGNVHVHLQPGSTITWISPEGSGLNVPWGVGDLDELPPVTGSSIESWEIN